MQLHGHAPVKVLQPGPATSICSPSTVARRGLTAGCSSMDALQLMYLRCKSIVQFPCNINFAAFIMLPVFTGNHVSRSHAHSLKPLDSFQ